MPKNTNYSSSVFKPMCSIRENLNEKLTNKEGNLLYQIEAVKIYAEAYLRRCKGSDYYKRLHWYEKLFVCLTNRKHNIEGMKELLLKIDQVNQLYNKPKGYSDFKDWVRNHITSYNNKLKESGESHKAGIIIKQWLITSFENKSATNNILINQNKKVFDDAQRAKMGNFIGFCYKK